MRNGPWNMTEYAGMAPTIVGSLTVRGDVKGRDERGIVPMILMYTLEHCSPPMIVYTSPQACAGEWVAANLLCDTDNSLLV